MEYLKVKVNASQATSIYKLLRQTEKNLFLKVILFASGDRGGTVVKVLCYKSVGRWFDPSWCHWNFSLT